MSTEASTARRLTLTRLSPPHRSRRTILIFEKRGEGYLPDELLQVAKIRLTALELSLSDIGKMLEPPISRSGVNHRLRKISLIADTLRGEDNRGE